MTKNYSMGVMGVLLVLTIAVISCGQNPKIKTITIINGDTSVSETEFNEQDFDKIEKRIEITMNNDEQNSNKTVKKILVSATNKDEEMSTGECNTIIEEEKDVKVTNGENSIEKRIVLKKGNETLVNDLGKIIKKETSIEQKENNHLKLHIHIKNTNATITAETKSKEPLNISILDEGGKQIFYDFQPTGGTYKKEIPLNKKGTYFLNLIQNKKSIGETIIIK
jgi:hypothetical protein